MFTAIFFVYALFASLTNSFIWKPVEQDESSSSSRSEADSKKENHPKNIILFLGQPTNSHDCKNEVLNYTEPQYVRFPTVISVKSCLKGNATHSEPDSPKKHLASHSDQQKCDYCEKALQQAISDLLDLATNVRHVQSGLIAVTNFSIYNINSGSKLNVHTFRGQHFQYRTGYDEAMSNQTEIQTEGDSQSESDGLIYTLMNEIHAIQTAFCKKLLQAFGYNNTPLETSENRYYVSDVPKLADLVHDMLKKFQSSHTSKGFVLIVNGGEVQEHCGTEEAVNLNNAIMRAMTETDRATTLVVVTSSCPGDNITEPFNITTKVYAQGPGSKELTNVDFLWNIPRILSKIWQKGFGATPTPADRQNSPVQNRTSQEANSWNYMTSEFSTKENDDAKNEDNDFAFPEQTENFNDQVEINTIEKEPEYQMKTLYKQDTKDDNLDHFLKNVAETLNTAKMNNDNDEMNIQQNSDAQKALGTSAKNNIVSYTGSTKKEHKGKPSVTHLPEQHTGANENLPKIAAFDKNDTNVQRYNVFMRNDGMNTSYNTPPLEEKERNPDKMLPDTEHISNLTLLSSMVQNQNSEEGLNANILIRKRQHNEEENILDNRSPPNETPSESITKNNKVSIHEKYPSSNIQLYREALPYGNYT